MLVVAGVQEVYAEETQVAGGYGFEEGVVRGGLDCSEEELDLLEEGCC
jgi:hypothetical protein